MSSDFSIKIIGLTGQSGAGKSTVSKAFENNGVAVIDAPLLIEAGMHKLCDELWVVYTSPEVQIQRAMARDGATLEQVQERIKNQSSMEEKKKLADRLISNDGTIQELYAAIDKILKDIVKENNDG